MNKAKYVVISTEIRDANHALISYRETEIELSETYKLRDVTDSSQRAVANMIEILKDYLTFR